MTDPLVDLENLAPGLSAAAAGVRLGEQAERLMSKFDDAARQQRRLSALIDLAVVLNAKADSQIKTFGDRALAAAQEAGEAMAETHDAASLDIAVESFRDYTQALGVLEANLRPVWRSHVDQQFSPLASVGGLLANFPGSRDLGQRMQALAGGAAASAQAVEPPEDLLGAVRSLLERRLALLVEQQAVADAPEVMAFLQALADQRATLDLLTPEVLAWLKAQDALTALQVVSAS